MRRKCTGITYGGSELYHGPLLFAVEIEPELRAILTDKKYLVVADDFLTYWPDRSYHYILMNPPFNQAAKHLLHAWDILVNGEIAAVMPKTLLREVDKYDQLAMRIINDHGSYEEIGTPFAVGAERHTAVEVIIVRLKKEAAPSDFGFDVHNDRSTPDFSDAVGNELTLNSFVGDILASYEATLASFAAYNMARQKVQHYIKPLASFEQVTDVNIYETRTETITVLDAVDAHRDPLDRYNVMVDLLTQAAWVKILDHPRFRAILTKRAEKMWNEFRRSQPHVDFNEHNIRSLFAAIGMRQEELLKAVVLDAFDNMTSRYPQNRAGVEGWKSNDVWKVNKRVVIDNACSLRYGGGFSDHSYHYRSIDDIDRAICVVTATPFDSIVTINQAIRQATFHENMKMSTFFKVRCFKKCTIHLWWLDEDVRQQFNIAAAQARGWLPPGEYDGTF